MKLDIRSNLPQGIKWTNAHTKELPFSIAQALTATSKGLASIPESKNKSIISELRLLAKQKLDRPTKGIQDGWFATTARKNDLKTVVSPKSKFKGRDGKEKGWNRSRYFVGNIKGGDRPNKWIELEARQLGTLPSNIDLVPTKAVKRDKFGNPNRRQIKTAFKNVGSGKTFIGKPEGSQRPFGIYKVKGTSLKALFVAKDSTSYPAPLAGLESKVHARARMVFGKYLKMRLKANVDQATKKGRADLRTGLFR